MTNQHPTSEAGLLGRKLYSNTAQCRRFQRPWFQRIGFVGCLLFACLASPSLFAQNFPIEDPEHWAKEDPDRIVTVDAPYIDIHTFAGRGYPIFHVIERGERLLVHKRKNDWFKVESASGKVGWVARNDMIGMLNYENIPLDFTTEGWQDNVRYPFQAGLLGGTFQGAISYTPYFGIRFTENIAAEFKYAQAFGEFSNIKIAALSVMHYPFPEWRISPFFRISSGVVQTNPATVLVQSEDREDPLFAVGGGLALVVTSHVVIRIEYDKNMILTTRDVNEEIEEWKAGFGVLF